MSSQLVNIQNIKKAHNRISKYIHKTPVFTSSTADQITGRKCVFKAENLQKTGSFKVRGALNAILVLRETNPHVPGVVTHSSGNHGQAIAWASRIVGLPCSVVVPQYSPEVKKMAIQSYGAELVECGALPEDRNIVCEKIASEKGYAIIPSYDHEDVIAGQGTIALELLEQVPHLDAILVSISGGGLSAGIAVAAKAVKPSIKIFLVEPEGKNMEESLREEKRMWSGPSKYLDTIADGIRLEQPGYLTFPLLVQLAEKQIFTLNNEEMIEGMKFAFERMKLVIEAAAGAVVAAMLSDKMKNMDPSLKNIGVILCGGNIDIDNLPWYSSSNKL